MNSAAKNQNITHLVCADILHSLSKPQSHSHQSINIHSTTAVPALHMFALYPTLFIYYETVPTSFVVTIKCVQKLSPTN